MLAREVLRLRGTIASRDVDWDIVVDLYFYRDPEAEENKEAIEEAKVPGAAEEVPAPVVDSWEAQGAAVAAPFVPGPGVPPTATAGWDADAGGEWATSGAPVPPPAGESWAADTGAPLEPKW